MVIMYGCRGCGEVRLFFCWFPVCTVYSLCRTFFVAVVCDQFAFSSTRHESGCPSRTLSSCVCVCVRRSVRRCLLFISLFIVVFFLTPPRLITTHSRVGEKKRPFEARAQSGGGHVGVQCVICIFFCCLLDGRTTYFFFFA